ncbi:MAG: Rrf2 family transcriptional regulator [Firmicutes bacterium]|nr:Rrf2 family transcriptional regulator [Bacillota bacterium]
MFPLSQATGYAVLALNCMEEPGGEPIQVATVAANMGLPAAFLAKVVNRLASHGLVTTRRGRHGGVVLARPAQLISLAEILQAVEGDDWDKGCFLGHKSCLVSDCQCPMPLPWRERIEDFKVQMAQTSLANLGCYAPQGIPARPVRGKCPEKGTTASGRAPARGPARG